MTACSKFAQSPGEVVSGEAVQKKVAARTADEFKALTNASQMTVRMVKDDSVPVAATFNLKEGELKLSESGAVSTSVTPIAARVAVDVASFNSGLLLRDDRVRSIFFETQKAENTVMTVAIHAVSSDTISVLRSKGAVNGVPVTGSVSYFGKTLPLVATIDLSITAEDRLRATSASPVIVKISELGLNPNLAKLMMECGHKSVADEVRVEFALEFEGVR